MSDIGFVLLLVFTAAFLGTFAGLALGWHLRLFGCHRCNREGLE